MALYQSELAERIKEKLQCLPEEILDKAGLEINDASIEIDETEARIERLARERERIGPVNLRAEIEVEELEQKITDMETERDDLNGAIDRLRRAISSLNKEGRSRLLQAFDDVNSHFQKLFTRLFGGECSFKTYRSRRSSRRRYRNHGEPSWQKTANNVTTLRGRAGFDSPCFNILSVLDKSSTDLCSR